MNDSFACYYARGVFALVASAFAQAQQSALQVSEIAPGLFRSRRRDELMTHENQGAIANVGFIIGADAVAVVDTGGSVAEAKRLFAAIRERTDKPIRYVINTHAHPDHVFGNAAFLGDGTYFVGHKKFAESSRCTRAILHQCFSAQHGRRLDQRGTNRAADDSGGWHAQARSRTEEPHLARMAGGAQRQRFDGARRANRNLVRGDLVFVTHIPVLDGSIRGWLAVIEELGAMSAHVWFPVTDREQLAGLPSRRSAATWKSSRPMFVHWSTTASPCARRPTRLPPRNDRNGICFDDYNARNATAAFSEIEWE